MKGIVITESVLLHHYRYFIIATLNFGHTYSVSHLLFAKEIAALSWSQSVYQSDFHVG